MSYGPVSEIAVRGFADLNRSLLHASKDLRKEIRDAEKDVAEPVRQRAEVLAVDNISHLKEGAKWSRMRTGVTTTAVYVAPAQHGRKQGPQKRPGFGPLLLDEAMIPALDEMSDQVMRRFEEMLDDFSHMWTWHG